MTDTWRSGLRRDIGWLLAVKFALLAGLWAGFFSGAHQLSVDAPATATRLALPSPPAGHVTVANRRESL
jgi:hypothetical protein